MPSSLFPLIGPLHTWATAQKAEKLYKVHAPCLPTHTDGAREVQSIPDLLTPINGEATSPRRSTQEPPNNKCGRYNPSSLSQRLRLTQSLSCFNQPSILLLLDLPH